MLVASVLWVGYLADAQSTPTAASSAAPAALQQTASGSSERIVLPEETPLRVRIERPLNTRRTRTGEPILFTLVEDVSLGGAVAIPRGATLHGKVEQAHKANALGGRPELVLKLESLELGGRSYPLYSYRFRMDGVSRTALAFAKIAEGAIIGAQVGNVWGGPGFTAASSTATRAEKAGEAAAAGAGVGTAVALVTAPPPLIVPAEAQLDFYLAAPLAIEPIGAEEAERLGKRVSSDKPKLYVRGER
jgi:hypothetical protein